jgi:hypothetical protein
MTYALVDNATLTAVQRILGAASARSRDAVEGDLAAFENLLEAVLLYDQVVAIDDYKLEFRAARAQAFPFVRFLDPTQFGLPQVAAAAASEGEAIQPVIRGGQFEEEFRALLDELKIQMECTWNVSSSVFYLMMEMMGQPDTPDFEKYGKISATIYSELQDQRASGGRYDPSGVLVTSDGEIIDRGYVLDGIDPTRMGGVSRALAAFLASLRWLAQRTIYYALAAEHLRGDAVLYPVRQAYHRQYMQKTARYDGTFVAQVVRQFRDRTQASVDGVIRANRPSHVRLPLPLFSPWLVLQTGDVRQVLDAALQLRDEEPLVRARAQVKEIRLLYEAGDTVAASRKIQHRLRDLDGALATVRERYGLRTEHGLSLATVIKVFNVIPGLSIPEVGESVRLPAGLRALRQRGVGALYRDISADLSDFPKLGRARDMLTAAVVVDEDARVARPRATDPKYRSARVSWKQQM